MTDHICLPRSLLAANPSVLWVYARLLDEADKEGNVRIRANSWCASIGLTRSELRKSIETLVNLNLITNCTTNRGANGRTNLTICDTANSKTAKPIGGPITRPIVKPIVTRKPSSAAPTFVAPEFHDAFLAWLEYKKEQFKFEYKTERSLKAAYAELVRLSDNDPCTAMQIVNQSMSNGWKGLFELKNNGTKPITTADTAATRTQSRNRLRTLASGVLSQSTDKLLSLYNGGGADPDTRQD